MEIELFKIPAMNGKVELDIDDYNYLIEMLIDLKRKAEEPVEESITKETLKKYVQVSYGGAIVRVIIPKLLKEIYGTEFEGKRLEETEKYMVEFDMYK